MAGQIAKHLVEQNRGIACHTVIENTQAHGPVIRELYGLTAICSTNVMQDAAETRNPPTSAIYR